LWHAALDQGHHDGMNEITGTKAMNTAGRDMPAGAAPPVMTVVAPPGACLSEQSRPWQQENRTAINCYNEWIAAYGLPLEEFRRF
jgi:hypothetical protein